MGVDVFFVISGYLITTLLLGEWRAATVGRSELFWSGGIHLRPGGAQFYANLIQAAVNRR